MSYFFILSGFVMIVAYGNKTRPFDTAIYLRNRAARILPLYYTAIILLLIYYFVRINVLNTPSSYYPTAYDTLLNGLLIQAWIPEKAFTLNPPAWSLSVEAFFYLSFPVIFYIVYKKVSYRAFMIFTIGFFILSQVVFHLLIHNRPQQLYFFYFLPALRLNEFLIGNGLGALFLLQRKGWKNSGYMLMILLIISAYVLRKDVSPLDFHNGLFAIFFAPMLFVLAMNQGTINRLFSRRPFVFLGEISYGVYLLQYPVYFFFTSTLTFFGRKITPPLFYAYLMVLLIVSAACYKFIEVPVRSRIRKNHATTQTKVAR